MPAAWQRCISSVIAFAVSATIGMLRAEPAASAHITRLRGTALNGPVLCLTMKRNQGIDKLTAVGSRCCRAYQEMRRPQGRCVAFGTDTQFGRISHCWKSSKMYFQPITNSRRFRRRPVWATSCEISPRCTVAVSNRITGKSSPICRNDTAALLTVRDFLRISDILPQEWRVVSVSRSVLRSAISRHLWVGTLPLDLDEFGAERARLPLSIWY
jgi:hypothetical protein